MAEDSQPTNRDLATELAQLVQAVELSGRAILPTSNDELLTSIVTAAARIFGAAGAAILLVDDDDEALVFGVAIGDDSQDLLGVRIPIDKGIAGYVAMTGQAIAVSNTEQDARFNKEFAKSVGYVPDSILATPLLSGDRVVGVIRKCWTRSTPLPLVCRIWRSWACSPSKRRWPLSSRSSWTRLVRRWSAG